MTRAAIILNPATADVSALREAVEKTMVTAGWSTPMWLETTPEDPGAGMAEAAVAAGVQLVVICGGDGTIMACLGALAGTDVPVALLPLGTGNLLARNLGVPIELRAGWPAYVVSGVRHLRDPVMRVQLRIDDNPPLRRPARTVLVGNVGRLQGGLQLLPDAAADDGLLDVVVVAPRTLRDWIRLVWRVFRRDRRQHPHLERFRGRTILIEADRIVPRQMDGDVIDDGRSLHARIEPGALVIRVPQPVATAA